MFYKDVNLCGKIYVYSNNIITKVGYLFAVICELGSALA